MLFILLLIPQPLRFPSATWPAFYMDDFYYYVVIAQNVLSHGISSFDGITPTNGYHPLYMLTTAALLVLARGAGPAFFVLLTAMQVLCYFAAIWQVARLLVGRGSPAPMTIGVTLIFAVAFSTCAITGMEVILAVPLILAFIGEAARAHEPRGLRPLRFGLLASACILARVDAAILVVLIAIAILPALWKPARRPRDLVRVCIGLAPAAAYFCINLAAFGAMLPLSSMAKALVPQFFFNSGPIMRPLLTFWEPVISAVITIPAWCILVCAIAGVVTWRNAGPSARLRTAICLFPPMFYVALAVRSDWMLWEWYLYPVVVALPFAAISLGEALIRWNARAAPPIMFVLAVLLGVVPATMDVIAYYLHQGPNSNAMFIQALALRPFMTSHPGTYAMGDQAGTATFLSGARVLQLEGLVEDRALLADIAARAPLIPVLRKRHVDYYIGTAMSQDGACWIGTEPKARQAGPRSPAMTGRFCSTPLLRITGPDHGNTLVFSVAAEVSAAEKTGWNYAIPPRSPSTN
jgi:hypothetical protein